jgi:hypothetical protein
LDANDKKINDNTSTTSLVLLLGYLIASVFAGIIFSILALRAKSNGKSGWGWAFMSMICIGIFSYLGYALYFTSSPQIDSFWYYLGLTSLTSNGLALIILIIYILKKY